MGSDPSIKQQLNQPFVLQLIHEATASSSGQTRSIADWTKGVLHQALSG